MCGHGRYATGREIPTEHRNSKHADSMTLDESCIMLDPWVELTELRRHRYGIARFAPPASSGHSRNPY